MRSDGLGHGTHVAGILSGSGYGSSGEHKGVATSAKLLSLKVLDDDGRGVASDTIAALDWLISYGSYFDIEVVNMSVGKGVEESNQTDPLVLAIEQVWDSGIVVVVAAGNYGRDGHMTITSPANSRKVITVGSLTDKGTGDDFGDDFVSTYSSVGPTLGDHVLKPDLVAPGNKVTAAVSLNSKLLGDLPDRVVNCWYQRLQRHISRNVRHQHGDTAGRSHGRYHAPEGLEPDAGHDKGPPDALGPQNRCRTNGGWCRRP